MNVKKFSSQTSREALRMVRDALGADAVILSNRTVNGGVEILALANADMASLASSSVEKIARADREVLPQNLVDTLTKRPAAPAAPPPVAHVAQPRVVTTSDFERIAPRVVAEPATVMPEIAMPPQPQPVRQPPRQPMPVPPAAPPAPTPAPTPMHSAPEQPAAQAEHIAVRKSDTIDRTTVQIAQIMEEIRTMRGEFQSQLAEISWGAQNRREPMKSVMMRELLGAGFSASLARYLIEKLPEQDGVNAMAWVKSILMRNLTAAEDENAILDAGGVFALVGPTGVGKTTTTAKLAARCVMRHGAAKLALITTDGYRIGGFEQLRIYGKILGVMVHSVKDETDLRLALAELKSKHIVLIDTAGAGQRDQMVAEQVAMLTGVGTPVKRFLCMSATSNGETLNEVVRAYKGNGLAGAIITKMDEAATTGSVLDVVIRQKLPLQYIANGQRVPEDLHLAQPNFLIDRAFKMKRETAPFEYRDDELPLVIGNTAHQMNDKTLREVQIG